MNNYDDIKPPVFDKAEKAWLNSHTTFRLGLTVDEILQQKAEIERLREQVRVLQAVATAAGEICDGMYGTNLGEEIVPVTLLPADRQEAMDALLSAWGATLEASE